MLSKTFNSSWTVLCSCAVGTGGFGSTPGNIKLINVTKKEQRDGQRKQADTQACSKLNDNRLQQ